MDGTVRFSVNLVVVNYSNQYIQKSFVVHPFLVITSPFSKANAITDRVTIVKRR